MTEKFENTNYQYNSDENVKTSFINGNSEQSSGKNVLIEPAELRPLNALSVKKKSAEVSFQMKLLVFLTTVCVVLTALLCFSLYKVSKLQKSLHDSVQAHASNVCRTSSCYKMSNFMLEHLNQSALPCDNFYEFSCGTWIDKNIDDMDHFTTAHKNMLQQLSDALMTKSSDNPIVASFKKFHHTCVNQTEIEHFGDEHFLRIMRREFGEWPLLTNNLSGGSNLEEHIAKLTTLKMPFLFNLIIDDYNYTKLQMRFSLPLDYCDQRSFYPRDFKVKQAFKKLVRDIVRLFAEAMDQQTTFKVDESQIDDMIALVTEIYFLNDTQRYNCKSSNRANVLPFMFLNSTELNRKITDAGRLVDFNSYVSFLNSNLADVSFG